MKPPKQGMIAVVWASVCSHTVSLGQYSETLPSPFYFVRNRLTRCGGQGGCDGGGQRSGSNVAHFGGIIVAHVVSFADALEGARRADERLGGVALFNGIVALGAITDDDDRLTFATNVQRGLIGAGALLARTASQPFARVARRIRLATVVVQAQLQDGRCRCSSRRRRRRCRRASVAVVSERCIAPASSIGTSQVGAANMRYIATITVSHCRNIATCVTRHKCLPRRTNAFRSAALQPFTRHAVTVCGARR